MDQQNFGFLDPDLQKYADPRIQVQNINQKLLKKFLCTQIWIVEKKRDFQKYAKLFEKSSVEKISQSYIIANHPDPLDPLHFWLPGFGSIFSSADPGSGSASKLNGS